MERHRPIAILGSAILIAGALTLAPAGILAQSTAPAATPLTELPLLWEAGGPAEKPNDIGTMAMAIDPVSGHLWVAVPHADRYWIMTQDGEYLESWGESGGGPGQFRFEDPSQSVPVALGAIAFAPDGSFYVADLGNYRIQHFAPDRTYLGEFGTYGMGDGQFSQPWSIATDGDQVYVGDCGRYDTQVFTPDGTWVRTMGAADHFCWVSLDGLGRLHIGNLDSPTGSAVAVFDSAGTELGRQAFDAAATAWAIAARPDGGSVVSLLGPGFTDQGIALLDPDGTRRTFAGGADSLVVAPDGAAVFASHGIDSLGERWETVKKLGLPQD